FALNTYVPVGLAPLVAHEWWPAAPARDLAIAASLVLIAAGAIGLARSAPVARVLAADASSSRSGTGRSPREDSLAASAASELRAYAGSTVTTTTAPGARAWSSRLIGSPPAVRTKR